LYSYKVSFCFRKWGSRWWNKRWTNRVYQWPTYWSFVTWKFQNDVHKCIPTFKK